ncbi:MAG: hypothetical protein KAV87_50610 [Desulfobacteraceae bacterium]|nr:hypothetical protein [Desulfobacteraceae bacterium]
MKEKKDIATLLQEAVDAMIEHGGTPYAIICNKKTWEKVALYFRKQSSIEEKCMPLQMWLKYDFGDLPVLKFKYSPDDRIDVLDKDTYERLMKETKGKYSLSAHFKKGEERIKNIFDKHACELLKTATYKRKGLKFDFGKKTIIKRIG